MVSEKQPRREPVESKEKHISMAPYSAIGDLAVLLKLIGGFLKILEEYVHKDSASFGN